MHEHRVQFYEKDAFLLDELIGFIDAGLEAGQAGVVIATQPHLDDLERRLRERSHPSGRYIVMDAAETLSKFMVDGWPDERLFAEVVGEVVQRAARDGDHNVRRVRAFGEMVSLLWAQGAREAAIRLEELWDGLAATLPVSVLCAYPMREFHDEGARRRLLSNLQRAFARAAHGELHRRRRSGGSAPPGRPAATEGGRAGSRSRQAQAEREGPAPAGEGAGGFPGERRGRPAPGRRRRHHPVGEPGRARPARLRRR